MLDSIVLIAIPIYNADGNERFKPQSVNRTEQNGPEMVGQRPNAQMLDLNRDYVKAEAPETRASLAMFEKWNPDVFVDLHTTDGSFHGYALTYAPSLNPAARDAGAYTRDSLLPELRQRMKARDGFEVFDYGNFDTRVRGARHHGHGEAAAGTRYDHRPRFGTNYFGLRERISILSEAYSHDPFERRVKSTYAFVRELLSLMAERGARIRAIESAADAQFARGDVRRADSDPLAPHHRAAHAAGDVRDLGAHRRLLAHAARCAARLSPHRADEDAADAGVRPLRAGAHAHDSARMAHPRQ